MKKTAGRVAVILLALVVLVSFIFENNRAFAFDDVGADHWAHDAIMGMYERGLVFSHSNRTFQPDIYVSRAEFIVLKGNNDKPRREFDFDDVPPSHWAYGDIMHSGTSGVGGNRWAPDELITWQEVIFLIWRDLGYPENNLCDVMRGAVVTQGVHRWARGAVGWAIESAVRELIEDGVREAALVTIREKVENAIENGFENDEVDDEDSIEGIIRTLIEEFDEDFDEDSIEDIIERIIETVFEMVFGDILAEAVQNAMVEDGEITELALALLGTINPLGSVTRAESTVIVFQVVQWFEELEAARQAEEEESEPTPSPSPSPTPTPPILGTWFPSRPRATPTPTPPPTPLITAYTRDSSGNVVLANSANLFPGLVNNMIAPGESFVATLILTCSGASVERGYEVRMTGDLLTSDFAEHMHITVERVSGPHTTFVANEMLISDATNAALITSSRINVGVSDEYRITLTFIASQENQNHLQNLSANFVLVLYY